MFALLLCCVHTLWRLCAVKLWQAGSRAEAARTVMPHSGTPRKLLMSATPDNPATITACNFTVLFVFSYKNSNYKLFVNIGNNFIVFYT